MNVADRARADMQVSELQARVATLEAVLHAQEEAHLVSSASAELASRETALAAHAAEVAKERKEVMTADSCSACSRI